MTYGRGMLAGVLIMMAAGPARAQQIRIESGAVELGLSGRVQFQFNTTSVDAEDTGELPGPAESTFQTRRVRLAAELSIADWITGLIEPDFAMGRLQIRNAWIDLGFSDAIALRAGQYKKPFSLIQLSSSSRLPVIERDVRIRGLSGALALRDSAGVLRSFDDDLLLGEEQHLLETLGYDAYDLGASLHGRLGALGYELGVFNGQGGDAADVNGSKSMAARATYALPTARTLRLGANVSVRDVLPADTAATEHGTAWGIDVEWGGYRQPGLWLLAEAVTGDNFAGSDFRGAHAIASFYVPIAGTRVEGVEPVFRASWGDPDTDRDGDAALLLTPGINLHFFGRNQLMFNWDWYLPQGSDFGAEHALRSQIQLYF